MEQKETMFTSSKISTYLINIIKKYNEESDDDYINFLVCKANEFIENRKLGTLNEQIAYYDFSRKILTNLYNTAFEKFIISEDLYDVAIYKINCIFGVDAIAFLNKRYANDEFEKYNDEEVKVLVDDYTKKYIPKDLA